MSESSPKLITARILRPFQQFAQSQTASGALLLACTAVALVWANSPWSPSYFGLWQTKFTVGVGGFTLSKPLLLWVNDGLMAIFFFVVGLEIKREVLVGELSSPRQAMLPILAAIGGMIVPAAIYATVNAGTPGAPGWGIPMATDIAFALGALALLGSRISVGLKVFLTALAIVDDIGAVLVIALFYTGDIWWASLAAGGVIFALLILISAAGIRHPLPYALLGAALWLAFLKSGVHATVSGVLLAMTIPSRKRIDEAEFVARGHETLDRFDSAGQADHDVFINDEQQAAVSALEIACEQVQPPLQRLVHALTPWVTFFIMPAFALANAGIVLQGSFTAALTNRVSLGVILGLVVGKQIGVTLFSWLSVKLKLATLPAGATWLQVYGMGWLAGIGFTMSIFVASLAFGDSPLLAVAKLGILAASLMAGAVGYVLLRIITARASPAPAE